MHFIVIVTNETLRNGFIKIYIIILCCCTRRGASILFQHLRWSYAGCLRALQQWALSTHLIHRGGIKCGEQPHVHTYT